MTSTLCLVMSPKLAVGLGGPIMLLTDIIPLVHYRRDTDRSVFLLLTLSAIVGMIIAGLAVRSIPDRCFATVIGLLCGLFAAQQLAAKYMSKRASNSDGSGHGLLAHRWVGATVGLFGGMAGILAHSGGIVFSIYMFSTNLSKQAYIGTLTSIFFATDIMKNLIYWNVNALTPDMIKLVLFMIPVMVLGGLLGYQLNKRIPPKIFKKLILAFVLVMSIRLIVLS